jgi:protease II
MLLHTETSGGHQGRAGRYDELAQLALMYAFAIWQTACPEQPACNP